MCLARRQQIERTRHRLVSYLRYVFVSGSPDEVWPRGPHPQSTRRQELLAKRELHFLGAAGRSARGQVATRKLSTHLLYQLTRPK